MIKGARALSFVSAAGNASTALELPMESEEPEKGIDVAELREEADAGENEETLSLSRSKLLDGEGRDDPLCADVRPPGDTQSASSSSSMTSPGSGGSGRLRRSERESVPADGKAGSGSYLMEGLLRFG